MSLWHDDWQPGIRAGEEDVVDTRSSKRLRIDPEQTMVIVDQ